MIGDWLSVVGEVESGVRGWARFSEGIECEVMSALFLQGDRSADRPEMNR